MDSAEGLRRKRKRSEDFPRPDNNKRRKTISCADGAQTNGELTISRKNKSLSFATTKKFEKFLPKTPKPVNPIRSQKSRGSLPKGLVKTEMLRDGKSPVESSAKKMRKSPIGGSSTKLSNTQLKSKIPTSLSLNKVRSQSVSNKSISKVGLNKKPLLKKSVLDRVARKLSPSKRAAPMQTVTFVSKIPSSFNFSSKTLPPTKVSPRKGVNKPSSSKKSIDPQEKASIKKPNLSKSFSSSRKECMTTKTSPKNTSLNRISESKQLILRKAFSNVKMNLSSAKTPAKNIKFSTKKNKPVRMSINNKIISKNISMEVKSSSYKKTPLALNKSMPAKISSSKKDQLTKSKTAQAKVTNECESNARSADKSTVKTPASKGKVKVEQSSIIKTSNDKVVTQGKSGTEMRELKLEIKKMSYSSAVKRKPVKKELLPETSKAADLKPVTLPRNIMIQVNKKPAFSNRHINSPDPIIISRQTLKSLGNRSVKKDLRKPMKSNTPKQTFKPSARPNFVPSSVRTPRASVSKILPQKISNKVNDAVKTPMMLKSDASTSKPETSRSKRVNANKSSIAGDSSTPSGIGIKYISMKNESALKSSMKQERGLISCKKVNFDMSHLNLKSSQGDKESIIDIRNVKDSSVNSEEPSKCFLAALELSCDSFLDGTTIISSPLKRTRRSSVKSQHIHASTPIQSARQADWLVNTPSSRMLMLHPSHSKSPAPGTSMALDFSASNTVSNSSKSNDTTHNLPYCEVYLTPHISTETLNISVENFVSPLTPGALGLNLKNASRLSTSQTRKSVTKPVSDSLEVFNSTSNSTRQSLNRSQTRYAAKASYPTKSPKNNLQDVSGVKQIFTRKSPGNDLRKNLSGVKRLLSSEQNSPKNDLRDVRGVKKLLSTPKVQKSPNNDLRNVRGVKKLLSSAKAQKSPKNDLRDVRGVKKLLSSPKTQKSPKNDLRDVRGVKKLLSSPKSQKSPKNDLRDVGGVKKLLSSPKSQKSPKNDLRDVRGVKKLLSSPKAQKSPKNDLRDVRGVKKLLSSPKSQKSPKNDLRDVMGVKRLLLTQKDPKNDLRNVRGLNLLMATPSKCSPKIEKRTRDQKPSLANRGEVTVDVEPPKNNQIKTECDVLPTKRKAEVTKEVPAKRKVKQEMSSPTIKPQDKQVVQRRTRRNVNELKKEESESSDLQVESESSSSKKSTARKTSSKLQVNADAAVTAKPRASKRTTKNVSKETGSPVTQSGKKSAGARRSSGSSKLRSNMRKRKSSGVLVVSAKKVQFNPHIRVHAISFNEDYNSPECEVKSSGRKRKTKKTENNEGESLCEKETPSRGRRSTKATTVVSKSTKVKPTRETRGAVAETSSEGTSVAAKPLKAKRATRTTKANAASEETPTTGKENVNSGKSNAASKAIEKEQPLKGRQTKSATKAPPETEAKTTRSRKVAAEKEKTVAESSTTTKTTVTKKPKNKENVAVVESASPTSVAPRRVLRKRN